MKITQGRLKEIILEEVSSILGKANEVKHDCATHVKELSTGKVGEVISHSLTEDGSVEYYDIDIEGSLKENVPVSQLEVVDMVEHMHSAAKRDDKLKKHKAKKLEEEGDKVTMHGCEFAKGLSPDAFGNAGRKCKPGMGKSMWLTKYDKYKSKGG